jgi:hypothetical protein
MKELHITINEEGEVEVEAKGYSGPACAKDLEKLQQALKSLGVETKKLSERKKPEYFKKVDVVKATR